MSDIHLGSLAAFKELGFSQNQAAALSRISQKRNGMVIIAGTSSSRCDVTINAMQAHRDDSGIGCPSDLVVYEDRMNDSSVIRSFSERGQKGRFILAPVHASSAFNVPIRLKNLSAGLINSMTTEYVGTVFQRPMLRNCPHCAKPVEDQELSPEYRAVLSRIKKLAGPRDTSGIRLRNPAGCFHMQCKNGVSGVELIAEVFELTPEIQETFADGDGYSSREHFQWNGGKTIKDNALDKVLAGTLDPQHAEHLVGLFEASQ